MRIPPVPTVNDNELPVNVFRLRVFAPTLMGLRPGWLVVSLPMLPDKVLVAVTLIAPAPPR